MHVKTRCVSAVVAFALICAGGIVSSLSAAVPPSARADDPPPGQVVYEPFLGSGTTLIAAQTVAKIELPR